jgi:endoglucanase
MGFLGRDKEYLRHELSKHLQFGLENNVPMSVLEFGLTKQNYTMPDAGGEQWVTDVIDLLDEHGASFAYWEYHGDRMGIYLRDEGGIEQAVLPTRSNPNLVNVLKQVLAQDELGPQ